MKPRTAARDVSSSAFPEKNRTWTRWLKAEVKRSDMGIVSCQLCRSVVPGLLNRERFELALSVRDLFRSAGSCSRCAAAERRHILASGVSHWNLWEYSGSPGGAT